jgi:hypothetical protein
MLRSADTPVNPRGATRRGAARCGKGRRAAWQSARGASGVAERAPWTDGAAGAAWGREMGAGDTVAAQLNLLAPAFTSRSVLARATTERLAPLVEAIAAGRLRVAIAARMPLADLEAAHAQSRTERLTGKIVVHP